MAIRRTTAARIPTAEGEFWLHHFVDEADGKEHLALVMGDVCGETGVLCRVHSECFTGDVIGSLRCDCGEQLKRALAMIAQEGRGVILYLRQEGRGIGLAQKLRAYNLQDEGYDTVDANLRLGHQADERRYEAAGEMLATLAINSIRLLTNNPDKLERLTALGVQIVARVALEPQFHALNTDYLTTKVQRMRHLLALPMPVNGNGHAISPTTPPLPYTSQPATSGHDHPVIRDLLDEQWRVRLADLAAQAAQHFAALRQPWVNLSFAQSLDGSIALRRGQGLQLSGAAAMQLTHALRAQHDAILVGIGTALADDPKLNVRLVAGHNPQPVIVDSHLRLPPTARLFDHHAEIWIATTCQDRQRAAPLLARGARLLVTPPTANGQVDLAHLRYQLGERSIRSLMVEGGAQILSAFLRQQLADYVTMTIAPRFVGGLHGVTAERPTATLLGELHTPTMTQLDGDLIVWGQLRWSTER